MTLVVAQFLAQTHGYAHLRADSVPRGAPTSHTQPCSECLSFAPLLASADTPVHPIAFLHAVAEPSPRDVVPAVIERFRHRPFQSRAPPELS